ncbi:ABC transporter permease [Brevundimonas sp. P7753]|jgi:hypothetical protein|uniref:ABC transporter permease n=1 Tax=Brevundimonas sp. P7753 TaxID=2726982 RepID=UPI0015BDC445|nr:ABC transporter permease [Brevundimonas sp. P7753]NWE52973.1 ABC transporter permease [Brevundimonas sp. P7753]
MNLAIKDIRFNFMRFALTALGIGFLLLGAIGAIGLYRGIVSDALLVIDRIGADLWVVQGERVGPFSEGSAIPATMDRRMEGVAGVAEVRRFVQFSHQFEHGERTRRATITGLDYPKDLGAWFELSDGRRLVTGHFEAIADASIGLPLGATIRLAQDDYRVVGLTQGLVDPAGDGLLIGARNRVIVAMIAEQAVLIGLAGFLLALLLAQLVFPHFPRRIAILPTDLAMLFAILFAICGMASAFGISQALRVRAQECSHDRPTPASRA